jgi:hypothetical protein
MAGMKMLNNTKIAPTSSLGTSENYLSLNAMATEELNNVV